jgi:hypothetical protein
MNLGGQFVWALLLAIPVACVVWTITQEEVFEELREMLRAYQHRHRDSLWRRKLAYLPTCSYCFSHYVAVLLVWLFHFKMLTDDWRGYAVSLFSLVLLANVYLTAYQWLRASLRAGRARADEAEAWAARARRLLAATARRRKRPPWNPRSPAADGYRVSPVHDLAGSPPERCAGDAQRAQR